MISATDLKNGTTFEKEGVPYKVIKYAHQKIGRGGATVKLVVRNLETGRQEQKTYTSTVKVDEIATIKKTLQFLYKDTSSAYFMDPATYEQVELSKEILKEELSFIKEGEEVGVLFWGEKPLSADIAPKVTLKVKETAPGVRGNSATNIYKPAKLENGMELKVPLFIKKGDSVVVDTRTSEYVERAK